MKKKAKTTALVAIAVNSAILGALGLYSKSINLPQNFTLTAHTGCEGTSDNSLEAITRGFEEGADIVEFDLNFNSDGVPVLAHDKATKSSPTVDEAFRLISQYDGLKVNVDCKKTTDLKAVVDLSEKYGIRDRIFYTGIEEKDVEAVKEQTPDVEYYLNVPVEEIGEDEKSLSALADKVKATGAVGINMKYTKCTNKLVKVFHEKGLLVSVWTVNKTRDMLKILPLDVDNITTRHPSLLKTVVEIETDK